jgi:PAS domain S-box-containing protein
MTTRVLAGWPQSAPDAAKLAALAAVYFMLAKGGLALASLNPSASPVWAPSGFALAAVLLWGYSVWPAVFAGAFLINLDTSGSAYSSLAIAFGNTAEAVVTAWMLERWSGGLATFKTPQGAARFAGYCLAPGAMISATIGVGSLVLVGLAEPGAIPQIWMTWWLGDVGGQILVAPVIVLWAASSVRPGEDVEIWRSLLLFAGTIAIGLVAFSPVIEQTPLRSSLAFLSIIPLLLAALFHGRRDTASVALLLSFFAVWGTLEGRGPFVQGGLNESFLLVLTFVVSAAVPSLVLTADVASRRHTNQKLKAAKRQVDNKFKARTADLAEANRLLRSEIERRHDIEVEHEQSLQLLGAQRLVKLGSWSWDATSGRITRTEGLLEIYGVCPGSIGDTVADCLARVHPEDRARVESVIADAARSGNDFIMEARIVRSDGEVRHLHTSGEAIKDARGAVVQMIGVCQDITERKKAELDLIESEQRTRFLIDGMHDYSVFMLDKEGRVASWNAGAERLTRHSAPEIIGQHCEVLYTEEDRAVGLPQRALNIAAEHDTYKHEGWRLRRDGSRYWGRVMFTATRNANDELMGYSMITRDLTERWEAQAALAEARKQVEWAQKLVAESAQQRKDDALLSIVEREAQLLRKKLSEPGQVEALDAFVDAVRAANL